MGQGAVSRGLGSPGEERQAVEQGFAMPVQAQQSVEGLKCIKKGKRSKGRGGTFQKLVFDVDNCINMLHRGRGCYTYDQKNK